MQIPQSITAMLEKLEASGHPAYLTGGCVRDGLLGKLPHDYDISTSALPEEIIGLFGENNCTAYGRAFGTVGVKHGDGFAEITTFRTEGDYSDSRHPGKVAFTSRVEEDLARRDFTINAMAYSPKRGLLDLFGGQKDLESGILRCVGVAQLRLREDALRILRGMRFLAKLGFKAEPLTDAAMQAGAYRLERISEERVFSELREILMGDYAREVLTAYPEIFCVPIPEIRPCIAFTQHSRHHDFTVWEHTARAVGAAPKELTVRLAMLLHDLGKPSCFTMDERGGHFRGHAEKSAGLADRILLRLKCDTKLRERTVGLVRCHRDIPETLAGVRRLRGRLGEDFPLLLQVMDADYHSKRRGAPEPYEKLEKLSDFARQCQEEALCCKVTELAVNGKDMLALGLRGKQVGDMLNKLLDGVIEGNCENTREKLMGMARTLC